MVSYDTRKLIDSLVERGEIEIASGFVDTILAMRAAHSLAELTALIEAGQTEAAIAMVDAHAARFASILDRVFVGAGQETIDQLGDRLGVVVNFEQSNARAVAWMQGKRLDLIREFTAGQREATRQALLDGIAQGLNPREQARAFRDSIGLTRKQLEYVENYRRELESLDPRALARQLRDGRFDRTIRDAIARESPLPRQKIEQMVGRYRERWIKHRAEVIARNESLEAAHAATDEAIRQAIESGAVDQLKAKSTWHTADDERVRDFSTGAETSHRTMDEQEQPFGEAFVSGAGNPIRYPGDPAAPLEDTIQCRCRVSTQIEA